MNRQVICKELSALPIEQAHGGSGSRQLIYSVADPISPVLSAVTKGFLEPGKIFDWHEHYGIDEFFVVIAGEGQICLSGEGRPFGAGSCVYIPANTQHRIENLGTEVAQFYFVRINSAEKPA